MIFTNINRKPIEKMSTLLVPENVLTTLTKDDFANQLQSNKGLFIIKFGAEWCGPCKKIDPLVYQWFSKIQSEIIQCAIIDIDDNFEIYAFLKNKKMVNGVPAILCYNKGTLTYVPDDFIIGANEEQINLFFTRCLQNL